MTEEGYFWLEKQDNNTVTVGMNDQGRDELGQVSFIDVPAVGAVLKKGDKFIAVEAEKAVTDIDSPVDGKILAVNEAAIDQPELLGTTDTDKNWIIKVKNA
ncbi:glycine cleavage system protein H [Lactobacillaceae bacterium 24-114]